MRLQDLRPRVRLKILHGGRGKGRAVNAGRRLLLHGQEKGSALSNPRHGLLKAAPPRLVVGMGAIRVVDELQGQRPLRRPVQAVDGLEAAEKDVLLGPGARVLGQRHVVPEDADVELREGARPPPASEHRLEHLLQKVPHLLQLNAVGVRVFFGQPAIAEGKDARGAFVDAALQHHRGRVGRRHQGLVAGELLQLLYTVALTLGEQPEAAHEPQVALGEDRRSLIVYVTTRRLQAVRAHDLLVAERVEPGACTTAHRRPQLGRSGSGANLTWLPSPSWAKVA
mmetsp:Transcript_43174/g.134937  ORF Transcript_43174/g.134937 Transcript_43174/m.134937 type:complete len:282 (+) Transcript_43174:650-1495(+)